MTACKIREKFFTFFENNGHKRVPSSPLVPQGDPTLLFTNAGMVQFKDYFLQKRIAPFSRVVSSQKCVRAGGKHNDLENVGRTARHHTFFEMLGNFSFGDYFKEGAILLAWEFLTKEMGLDPDKLYITVFRDDDEACEIWQKTIGVPTDKISRMDEESNFWSMGDLGPCGPCSEILYDQGDEIGCGKESCVPGCECDRYLEIWNLVFMQYERVEGGELVPLKKKCVDTGMGLERITAVVEGVKTNFDCDLFSGIHEFLVENSSVENWRDEDVSFRVIEDHSRAIAFLINDGVIPSNEERGYVLRKILRRAARHARKIGFKSPILFKSVGVIIDEMRDIYPELEENRNYIISSTLREEERFRKTLDFGMGILQDLIRDAQGKEDKKMPGKDVFKLYDTYGFPKDLTEEIAAESAISLDHAGFEEEMKKQRDAARSSRTGEIERVPEVYIDLTNSGVNSKFGGYDYQKIEKKANALVLIKDGKRVKELLRGEKGDVILDKTAFYAESGGQTGDTGVIKSENGTKLSVIDTQKITEKIIAHKVKVLDGSLKESSEVEQCIDIERRKAVAANHTATHILQWALKEVLGDHIKQAGSLVTPSRMRFDFSHFSAVTDKEIEHIENIVNSKIMDDEAVKTKEMAVDEAIDSGATALFGEKYGEEVRVVSVGGYSKELCGGTHAKSTGTLGYFVIVSEGGISAGHRRIEAYTGTEAHNYVKNIRKNLKDSCHIVKSGISDLPAKLEQMISMQKNSEKEVEKLQTKLANLMVDGILAGKETVNGLSVIIAKVEPMEVKNMRIIIDRLKEKLKSGVILLGSPVKGNGLLLAAVTDDLTPKIHAGKIIKQASTAVGGKGGGKPTFAQGGGISASRLDDSLEEARKAVSSMLCS